MYGKKKTNSSRESRQSPFRPEGEGILQPDSEVGLEEETKSGQGSPLGEDPDEEGLVDDPHHNDNGYDDIAQDGDYSGASDEEGPTWHGSDR